MTYTVPLIFLIIGCALLFAGGFLAGVAAGDWMVARRRARTTESLANLRDALRPVGPRV